MATELERRVTRLESDMEETRAIMQQLALTQVQTQQTVNRLSERVDSFVFEAQRLLSNHGGRLERIEAAIETLVATSQRHEREAAADRAESAAFRLEIQSMTSRLDALVHHLMRAQ